MNQRPLAMQELTAACGAATKKQGPCDLELQVKAAKVKEPKFKAPPMKALGGDVPKPPPPQQLQRGIRQPEDDNNKTATLAQLKQRIEALRVTLEWQVGFTHIFFAQLGEEVAKLQAHLNALEEPIQV
jgi:hypothetical protein